MHSIRSSTPPQLLEPTWISELWGTAVERLTLGQSSYRSRGQVAELVLCLCSRQPACFLHPELPSLIHQTSRFHFDLCTWTRVCDCGCHIGRRCRSYLQGPLLWAASVVRLRLRDPRHLLLCSIRPKEVWTKRYLHEDIRYFLHSPPLPIVLHAHGNRSGFVSPFLLGIVGCTWVCSHRSHENDTAHGLDHPFFGLHWCPSPATPPAHLLQFAKVGRWSLVWAKCQGFYGFCCFCFAEWSKCSSAMFRKFRDTLHCTGTHSYVVMFKVFETMWHCKYKTMWQINGVNTSDSTAVKLWKFQRVLLMKTQPS